MKTQNYRNIIKPELLAPAGSIEGLKAVIAAGADAVYIGGTRFGARAYAANPEEEDLAGAIDYAHLRGVKVYLTVNTLFKNQELDELYGFLLPYYKAGVDAVLVQDFGALLYIREHFPDLPLHASTQMTVTGPKFGALLKAYGVERLVPAREMTMEELREIRRESGLEVEVFIHGALCCCYSGQCLYSSLLGGRSGNRGRCAQPCRLLYLKDDTSFDGKTSILDQPAARHFLSPKDLNTIDLIPEFFRSHMASLKIEGRMKQPEYAAGVTSIYRKYIDLYAEDPEHYRVSDEDHRLLMDLYNRSGFTDGYLHRHNGPEMMAYVKHELTGPETEARHQAYEVMHRRYIDREKKIPIEMHAVIRTGEPAALTLITGGVSVCVSGSVVDRAKNRPLDADRIREAISKTGTSDYEAETVSVDTDGQSFVPVSALNELRRLGIERLTEELLSSFRRDAEVPAEAGESFSSFEECEENTECALTLTVLAGTEAQMREALTRRSVSRIYVESSLLLRAKDPCAYAAELAGEVIASGKEAAIALPYIERKDYGAKVLMDRLDDLIAAGISWFLVRNPESMAEVLFRIGPDRMIADAGLYSWNRGSKAFLQQLGIRMDTAPVELNRKELYGRDDRNSELIAYGRLPLMVTVQCLKKGTEGCSHSYDRFALTDRMGVDFDVECDCSFCYNIVRNSVPLMLGTELPAARRMGFRSIRIQFSEESAKESAAVLDLFEHCLAGEEIPAGSYTKGHFLRGVE